jgi:hypothetical protein
VLALLAVEDAAGFAAAAAGRLVDALDPLAVVAVRPRSAAPCRCATRYTDDSPIP